jgi:hypothetical protein
MSTSPVRQIRDIGIPVRSVNWVRLHAGRTRDGHPCLYATMGQQADNLFVLQIDPETGTARQFLSTVPSSNYPTATLMSRTGRLYVGSAYAGHLLCFDPEKDALENLGAIHPQAATFPCRIDEDENGLVWIGSYPAADLTCYDPRSGAFVRYGRMDDVDMYNYPLAGSGGTIANLVRMTKPHVVVFEPKTGRKETVGPVTVKGEDTIDLSRGNDGRLYITSSKGNFRVEGATAVAVECAPAAMPAPGLPDGRSFRFTDGADYVYRDLEIASPGGEKKLHKLDYPASGSEIFYLHKGPDGCLYGSSILPLHLFRYDPRSGELSDLGKCSEAGGEAYSMANLGDYIYISSYPSARVSVYDPSREFRFGSQPEHNPRELGPIDEISYRPRSTVAGPGGKVWIASLPDYGRWGGPLSCYDPRTGEKKAYYRIAGNGSCYTLAHLETEGLLAVGTSISGGSGTQPKVDQAVLFLWDFEAEEKVWEGTLDRPVSAFTSLLAGPDGRLYGIVVGKERPPEIFVFDPRSRRFTDTRTPPTGHPLELGLQTGPDGKIYGFTSSCIYRLDPATLEVEVILEEAGAFRIAGPIIGQDIHFAACHRLRAVRIF